MLKKEYEKSFFSSVNSDHGTNVNTGNKLRTYAIFKNNYNMEPYLTSNLQRPASICLAKFRTSSHNLEIETGRYCRPKLPPEQRLCKICPLNQPETENHFLLHCPAYRNERQDLLNDFPQVNILNSDNDKLRFLMTLTDTVDIQKIALYLLKITNKRKCILNTGTNTTPIATRIL